MLAVPHADGGGVLLGVSKHGECCEAFLPVSMEVIQFQVLTQTQIDAQGPQNCHEHIMCGVVDANKELVILHYNMGKSCAVSEYFSPRGLAKSKYQLN